MRKLLLCLALGGVTGVLWLGRPAPQANADKTFRDEFVAVYVKAESSEPKDEKSPTFGELIRAGKLPGEAPKTSESHASLQGATVR